jgi:hypothetical protein
MDKINDIIYMNITIDYFKENNKENYPITTDDWVNMFDNIYGSIVYNSTIEQIAFHFQEEIGEVTRIITKYDEIKIRDFTTFNKVKNSLDKELQDEIADVFSWVISLLLKLRYIESNLQHYFPGGKIIYFDKDYPLSSLLYNRYKDGCPNCESLKCLDNCRPLFCSFVEKKNNKIVCVWDWKLQPKCNYSLTEIDKNACEYSIE